MKKCRPKAWMLTGLIVTVVACGTDGSNSTDVVTDTGEDAIGSCNVQPTIASLEQTYFKMSCTFSSCHSEIGAQGGLVLTEGNAHANLVGVAATHAMAVGAVRVVAGDPDASYLVDRVELTSQAGPMPPNINEPLGPDCQIKALRAWIAAGAPQ